MPNGISPEIATQVMQYVIGFLMALLPAAAWGFVFYKKSPEKRKTVLVSFLAGTLSVLPMFAWQHTINFSFDLWGIKIPDLNIYRFIQTLSANPSLEKIAIFFAVTTAISLVIYISAAVIVFVADILFGTKIRDAWRNVTKRSIEEPIIFIACGLLTAGLIVVGYVVLHPVLGDSLSAKLIYGSLWTSVMVGFLEEYSKHLVVRFTDDQAIYSISSAIEFSIIVALGFAFLENILYFVDKIWLAPCTPQEIATNVCLLDQEKGVYTHQVGVLLVPFVFRSLLSTLAHLVFSGIFGYYYGVAHFASYELQEAQKKKWGMLFWGRIQSILKGRTRFLFHEVKIFQGLLFAMFFHGLFNFALDQEKTFITVPMIAVGYVFLSHLLNKTEHHKKLRLIVNERTSETKEYQGAVNTIELLEKYEKAYEKKHQVDPKQHFDERMKLLERYEEMMKKTGKQEE